MSTHNVKQRIYKYSSHTTTAKTCKRVNLTKTSHVKITGENTQTPQRILKMMMRKKSSKYQTKQQQMATIRDCNPRLIFPTPGVEIL